MLTPLLIILKIIRIINIKELCKRYPLSLGTVIIIAK